MRPLVTLTGVAPDAVDAARTVPVSAPPRNAGLDVLRGSIALLVVAHHTAITYGGSGDWFYREIRPSGAPSSLALSLFCGFNQAWFMGLFFLIAGYFTPPALARHGPWAFARERLRRLGIPILVFGYGLAPIAIALARTARGAPFFSTLLTLWSKATFDIGPPWFCWALLIFSASYLVFPKHPEHAALPSDRMLLAVLLATGAAAFLIRLAVPVGVNVARLQLGYFAGYVVLFATGCAAARDKLLERVPRERALRWALVSLAAFPFLPLAILAGTQVPILSGSTTGGWTFPALIYAFWEPFVACGVILSLLVVFQERFAAPGPIATALGRRAFGIFIIHPPVVVGAALLIRSFVAPPLLKFAVVVVLSSSVCFLLAGLLLRVPGLRRIF